MASVLFAVAGIVSGIHVFSYGLWLRSCGNTAGSVLAFLLAALAMLLPLADLCRK